MAARIESRFGLRPTLMESGGGVFEVTVNGKLIFSKKKMGRFPEEEEILSLLA